MFDQQRLSVAGHRRAARSPVRPWLWLAAVALGASMSLAPLPAALAVNLDESTVANLPAPDPNDPGLLKFVTDSVRGVWIDQGTQWYPLHGDVVNVKNFGAKGDGTTDDLAAFNAALAAIESLDSGGNRGATLHIPYGTYRLSGSLHIERSMILQGVSGAGNYGGTVLRFDSGVTGIIVHRPTTSPGGGRGDWSVIRDLIVTAAGKSGTAHGIQLHARANIENCLVRDFSGNGIHIHTSTNPSTNANNWKIENTRSINNGGHGLYTNGPDSNAGVATGLDASGNDGWGVYDSSFLGNTYVACHTAANGLGAYKSDSLNGYNVLVGCYSEAGQPGSELERTSMVLGGIHGAGFTDDNKATVLRSGIGGAFITPSVRVVNDQGDYTITTRVGVNDTQMNALELQSSKGSQHLKFRYAKSGTYFPIDSTWEIVVGAQAAMGFGTDGSTHYGPGDVYFRNKGYYMIHGNARAQRILSNAVPTTGTWDRGSIVWNRSLTAGGAVGWICTTAGTPGTWVPFGHAPLQASTSWNPSSMAHGEATSTTLTVTGAAVGDLVTASHSTIGSNVVMISGHVQATNTVRVVLQNLTGSSLNLASGTLSVKVTKPE